MNSPAATTTTTATAITLFTPSTVDATSGDINGGVPAPAIPELETISRCVRKQSRVSWGYTSVIGRRAEMEDAVAVVPGLFSCTCRHVGGCTAPPPPPRSDDISPVHYFAVFDGHGGSQVAEFCAERMHELIVEEWAQQGREHEHEHEHGWQRKWEETLCNGFRRADDLVMTEGKAAKTVGSTAVVAVVSGCQIILSNCGDSRAVLCTKTGIIPLSVDHKPDREDELSRIEALGGKVFDWKGYRVSGVLAMSRAIGDSFMRPYVIPVPEITFTTRSEEDECIILASDGLWDVMSNEEVGKVTRNLLRRMRRSSMAGGDHHILLPAQLIADTLTELAIGRRRCSSDNISIILVDLKSRRLHQHQHQ